ncbi:sulfatase-like hydrolase/transferase [Zavarzinia sp. CC-PAN008]|uniref:sulfatase-like hydrolase/transferase n=1 Tax=Zavarzinia sp. CC-PAN008 TaxID=3243332 RepID=UPI003F745C12
MGDKTDPAAIRAKATPRPHWPDAPRPPHGAPNILVVLFDDVGFSDFGCYGSPIATPTIDAIAARGLRYSGFHTTAMCSTTRAALLTGRNHHSVGMGCLANFDSGLPGYRGKISRAAATLPEMLRGHGYRNYMVGKWHVTPLTETGPSGPFDGWPLGRGFDRFYGFMDAETDQYAPELVRDNTPIEPPGTFESGYHLTADLVDQTIRYIADHLADAPTTPWLAWLAFGACHAPHQAPASLIRSHDALFAHGWDFERAQRLERQKAMGLVPPDTVLPPRNDHVRAWDEHGPDEQRLFTRLQSAFAAMLAHADQQLARLMAFLEEAGVADDTLVLVLSDNGASQEGGPLGMVNAMGPYNFRPELMPEKIARIDDIGGPDTHSNFPHGWAMASNTPLRRYKQNTHGGGIRDPLVISWPARLRARGEVRHQFAHACDLVPTLLDLLDLAPPASVAGVAQMPLEGVSFAASLADAQAPPRAKAQYFEMFGHRGLWRDGWKAVAFHPPGKSFDADVWELYHLEQDFAEVRDLAAERPDILKALVDAWWVEADRHAVLPLDDRFGPRFAENAARFHGPRRRFVFHRGMGHLPTDVAPDVRSRSYRIEAEARLDAGDQGVLIAHGDATCGYSLFVRDGHLVHDMNVGGAHVVVTSTARLTPGPHSLGVAVRARPEGGRRIVLLVDGQAAGAVETPLAFVNFVSWSGLDIGRDRGSPVADYAAPFAFTGHLKRVTVTMDDDQALDGDGLAQAELARQ